MSGPISDYECETCGKAFPAGGHARDQHCEDTGHCSPEFECPSCPRWFNSEQACEQHIDATGHYWETWDSDGYGCRCCMDTWATEMDRDDHEQEDHFYCSECDRFFDSYYSLDQHLSSRIHRGQDIVCPFCDRGFVTATSVTHHLETSACPNARGLNRDEIYRFVRSKDPSGSISKNLLGWAGSARYDANKNSWNGHGFECVLCHREFGTLLSLNQHLNSPTHQMALYHCPNSNCRKDFKTLADIISHLESESCGYTRANRVQASITNIISGNRRITF